MTKTVEDGVGDQANRFDRRVHNERLHALARDDVLPGIFPDIGPVPPVGPKLDVVDCWAVTMPEDEHKLMLHRHRQGPKSLASPSKVTDDRALSKSGTSSAASCSPPWLSMRTSISPISLGGSRRSVEWGRLC
jgi:hypothetical protein